MTICNGRIFSLLNSAVVLNFYYFFARVASLLLLCQFLDMSAISVTIRVAFAFYLVIFLFPFVGEFEYIDRQILFLALFNRDYLGFIVQCYLMLCFQLLELLESL